MRPHLRRRLTAAVSLALACQATPADSPRAGAAATQGRAFAAADAGYREYARGAYAAAAAHARSATELAPRRRDYWLLLAQAQLALGELEAAEQALARAAAAEGNAAGLLAVQEAAASARAQAAGEALYRAASAGDVEATIGSGSRAVALAPGNVAYRLLLARALLQAGRPEEAERSAEEATARRPGDPAALMLRAFARQALGRADAAQADADLALRSAEPGTQPDAMRHLRLAAADLALAEGDANRAAASLQDLASGDPEAATRQEWARQQGHSPHPALAGAALPALDCGAVGSAGTCLLQAGRLPPLPGYADAAAAYAAMHERDAVAALRHARLATQASPAHRDWQLLRMEAALAAGEDGEAEHAAGSALALDATPDPRVLVRRARMRLEAGDPAGASRDADAALATGSLPAAAAAALLQSLGRSDEARQQFALAEREAAAPKERVALAYVAVSLGDDASALRAFDDARREGVLPASALVDAGYAALRAGDDASAAAYLDRALAEARTGELEMSPQRAHEAGRAAAEVSRTWGLLASATRRNGPGVAPGFGAIGTGSDQRSTQAGVEAYWRPLGYRNGRYVEVFLRGFATLDAQPGVFTGGDSFQGGAGVRWKPFTAHNLTLSVGRVFGPNVADSWLAQVGYSLDTGTDLRLDVPDWTTTRIAAEAGRYFGGGRHDSYALASLTAGRSFRAGDGGHDVIYPHVFLGAEHRSDDPVARTSTGAGVGASFRRWFGAEGNRADGRYWELTVQYRFRLSGDERMKGPYVGAVLSF